jgi:hypothetical protein
MQNENSRLFNFTKHSRLFPQFFLVFPTITNIAVTVPNKASHHAMTERLRVSHHGNKYAVSYYILVTPNWEQSCSY